jgi:hypothetical protein
MAPEEPGTNIRLPVACTLTPDAIQARRAALLPGLLTRAVTRHDLADGFRIRFRPDPDLLAAIAQVVDAERQCCQFLQFQITIEPANGPIWLDVTGPDGTRDFLAALLE